MKLSKMTNHRTDRQKCLAFTLLVALGLAATGVAAAATTDQTGSMQSLGGLDLSQVPDEVLAPFAGVLAERAQAQTNQTMGGTITVSNCNDSGSGSLRAAVAAASSGDTIDLSHLTCTRIELASGEITIPDASLTIKGAPGTGINVAKPTIDALHSSRIFSHTGTGQLALQYVTLQYGYINPTIAGSNIVLGGCVYSDGAVRLDGAYIMNCSAESHSNVAGGGGVYAEGNITLTGDSWIVANEIVAQGRAWGGGLYTESSILAQGSSLVSGNSATVEGNGFAQGGGIYAGTGIIGGTITLKNNTVEASGASAQGVQGGGAYSGGNAVLGNLIVNKNHALGPNSEGGGLYAKKVAIISDSEITENDSDGHAGGLYTGVSTSGGTGYSSVKTSTLSDNTAGGQGGGIYAEAGLEVEDSTVADNTAGSYGGGLLASNGLIVTDSNVIHNDAATSGGGIYGKGYARINGSTLANNTSKVLAGATLGADATQPISINQSTISGNHSSNSNYGAGLYLKHDAVIKNSTITENVAQNASDTKYGAGISLAGGVQLTLSSTIVSGNSLYEIIDLGGGVYTPWYAQDDIGKGAGVSTVYDILGSHNLIAYSAVTTPADTMTAGAQLNDLADNGGPTQTHLPKATSPAIDYGVNNGFDCDQRGGDHARVVGFAADIGSVEVQADENTDRIFADGFEPTATVCSQ